ncbi:MAG: hypothetical protein IJS91_07050 [Bacteroidales bacterium]|jgi:hypothetical protein|nr:hypothetical protein [Bacteroidales bacterium]
MRYLIRALKYLVYFVVLFFVIVGIIWLITPKTDGGFSLSAMFQPGALPKIAILFLVIAAGYPYFAFTKRKVYLGGTFAEKRDVILACFEQWGYEIENEEPQQISFRLKSKTGRFTRMYEDRIVIETQNEPIVLNGYRRDIDRMARNINYSLSQSE